MDRLAVEQVAKGLAAFLDHATGRYLGVLPDVLFARIEQDFPPERRLIDSREVHFKPEDLPDFVAMILPFTGQSAITLFGRGPFEGLVLQQERDGERVVDVRSSGAVPTGSMADVLADCLVRKYEGRRQPGLAAAYGQI